MNKTPGSKSHDATSAPTPSLSMRRPSSKEVLSKYIDRGGDGEISVIRMFGKECYEEWINTRKKQPVEPFRAFQCAIRNVVTGANGTLAFEPEIEAKVLDFLRTPQPDGWPCFQGSTMSGTFGWKSVTGFHERNQQHLNLLKHEQKTTSSKKRPFMEDPIQCYANLVTNSQVKRSNTEPFGFTSDAFDMPISLFDPNSSAINVMLYNQMLLGQFGGNALSM